MSLSALIVYASFTGNTESLAEEIKAGLEAKGVSADMRICTEAGVDDFLSYDICLVGTYTWGSDAELPDEMYDFYDDMEKIDLSGKVFGSFGTGDIYYDFFCQSVDDFDAQFIKTGASRGAEVLKIAGSPDEEDQEAIQVFVDSLVNNTKDKL